MNPRRQFLKLTGSVFTSSLMASASFHSLASRSDVSAQSLQTDVNEKSGSADKTYQIVALVFDDYETLDLHGPIEMLGHMKNVDIKLIANTQICKSYQGPRVVADLLTSNIHPCDLLIIPGGIGTRSLVANNTMTHWLTKQISASKKVFSICTGSALLAKTVSLNHHKATTNKMAYQWVTSLNHQVDWQPSARWVDDRKFLTSSGVSAGTDAALYWVSKLKGINEAQRIARLAEYTWNHDPKNDPFEVSS